MQSLPLRKKIPRIILILPADYIIILDRTRTMSLSDIDHEDSAGSHNYMGYHSPCINPAHDYYKGGIYLHMLDYDTGFDYRHDVWIDDLRNMEFWNRHYDQNGAKLCRRQKMAVMIVSLWRNRESGSWSI